MPCVQAPQGTDQLNLFHPIPVTPRWAAFPLEARQKTLYLMGQLLRQYRHRLLRNPLGVEVRDE
jgi:hypothetical protein